MYSLSSGLIWSFCVVGFSSILTLPYFLSSDREDNSRVDLNLSQNLHLYTPQSQSKNQLLLLPSTNHSNMTSLTDPPTRISSIVDLDNKSSRISQLFFPLSVSCTWKFVAKKDHESANAIGKSQCETDALFSFFFFQFLWNFKQWKISLRMATMSTFFHH
jgi:hypothetical protein